LTPADRAALIARAKAKAIPVASCVAASLRPDHLFADVAPEDLEGILKALVIILAEACDPVRLREVVSARDDGTAPVRVLHGGNLDGRKNAAQVKDYAVLRVNEYGIAEAAAELGITKRTAERYEAVLVAAGNAPWREAAKPRPALRPVLGGAA